MSNKIIQQPQLGFIILTSSQLLLQNTVLFISILRLVTRQASEGQAKQCAWKTNVKWVRNEEKSLSLDNNQNIHNIRII